MSLTLVIGGTRSGKSARAEALAAASGLPVRYVATADAGDASMQERIARHVARRPPGWTTVEAGGGLAEAVLDAAPGTCVLVDGLGPWLARTLQRAGAFGDAARVADARATVLDDLRRLVAAAGGREVILVAEEAGQGLLPADPGSRAWLDLLGEAVQRLAEHAERVELVVAGRTVLLAGAHAPAETLAPRHHGDAELRDGDADRADRYPDEAAAVAALAALHGRAAAEVVPVNGATQALWLLPPALRPTLAACVHPGFTEGEAALRAHGVPVARVLRDPERDFALDPAAVPEAADLVLVGNPASPSGTLDPAAAVLALRRPGRVVVVDEAFMDLVPGEPGSLVREPLADVVVVRSLTKSLSLAGVRAGYAVTAPGLADRLRAVRPPWSVNALALAAMSAAGRRPHALAEAALRAEAERGDLSTRLASITGVRLWPASANFCLVEVADGPHVVEALRAHGIAVRPAASFPGLGPGHLRLTARDPQANRRLAEALAEAVA